MVVLVGNPALQALLLITEEEEEEVHGVLLVALEEMVVEVGLACSSTGRLFQISGPYNSQPASERHAITRLRKERRSCADTGPGTLTVGAVGSSKDAAPIPSMGVDANSCRRSATAFRSAPGAQPTTCQKGLAQRAWSETSSHSTESAKCPEVVS